MDNPRIYTLKRLIKLMLIVSILWIMFVALGFFDSTEPDSADTIRIPLPRMQLDNPYLIRFDNRQLIVILYSEKLQASLFKGTDKPRPHLVAYAYGTNLGCPIEIIEPDTLQESCSDASYDFAGRAINNGQGFTDLRIPVYTFCSDFTCLTIKP